MLRGSAIALAVKGLAVVSAFGMTVIVSRQLGATEGGLFFLGYTIVLVASAVSRLGLENTFVRFIAADREVGDWGRIRALYAVGMRWSFLASVVLSALLFALAGPLSTQVFGKPELAGTLRVLALGIPLTSLFTLHAKVLQGLKRVAQSLTVLSVAAPLTTGIGIVLMHPTSAENAAWVFVAAGTMTLGVGIFWWYRSTTPGTRATPLSRREILDSSVPLFGVVVLSQIVAWSSQLLVGIWGSGADVAIYNAAQRTAMLTSFVLLAVNSIAAPKFAALYRSGSRETLRATAINATRLTAVFAVVPLLLMLAVPETILAVFGNEFKSGATALQILAIGQFVNASTGSVGFLLSMTGQEALLRRNVFISALLTVGLGVALTPFFGVAGAAVATAVGVAVQNLLHVGKVQQTLGFNTLAIWQTVGAPNRKSSQQTRHRSMPSYGLPAMSIFFMLMMVLTLILSLLLALSAWPGSSALLGGFDLGLYRESMLWGAGGVLVTALFAALARIVSDLRRLVAAVERGDDV